MAYPSFELEYLVAAALICVSTLVGCCSLFLALGRQRGGMVLGVIVALIGAAATLFLLQSIPRYWWLGLPPIYLGFQSLRSWRVSEPSFIRIGLSSIILLMSFLLLMTAGVGSVYRQRLIEAPIINELQSLMTEDYGEVMCSPDGIANDVLIHYADQMDMKRVVELIGKLHSLRSIQVSGDGFADVDLNSLSELHQLRSLFVQQTDFGDEHLEVVSKLPRLQTLDLIDTEITKAGVLKLSNMKSLQQIWLSEQIDEKTVELLRKAKPDAVISH